MPPRDRPFASAAPGTLPTVIGCDEVGRGCLAGPLLVAACWFEPTALPRDLLASLDDSKRLSARERTRLAVALPAHVRFAMAAVSVRRIDRLGIRMAVHEGMVRAVARLGVNDSVVVDGNDLPRALGGRARAVVGADRTVPQVSAAAILAKVCRDRLMAEGLARRYPGYGWETNVGYGAAAHLAALCALGPTPHHRRSFAPLAQAEMPLAPDDGAPGASQDPR